MLKVSYAGCFGLFQLVSAQFALEMCLAVRRRPKIHKTLFCRLRSSKVIKLGANRERVYDFLLVINSNLSFIPHRYGDKCTKH